MLLGCAFDFLRRSDDPNLIHDLVRQDPAEPMNGSGELWCWSALAFGLKVQLPNYCATICSKLLMAQIQPRKIFGVNAPQDAVGFAKAASART